MNVLILYAHPEPTSFCAALKDTAVATLRAAGHSVTVSDLYAEGFNPVAGRHDFTTVADATRFHYQSEQGKAAEEDAFAPDLKREQARFKAADCVILIFPLWWGGMPAILKGWFDRVMAYGFAYVDGARFDKGLYPDKRGLVAMTTGGTPQRFSQGDVYGPVEGVLMPVERLCLGYMGIRIEERFVAYGVPRVDDAQRAAYLVDWRGRLQALGGAALRTERLI